MNLILRFIWVVIRGLRLAKKQPADSPLGPFSLPMVVLPNDLDLNFHMNNGRYLSIMDLGRMDLLCRMGIMGRVLREKWMPIVGAAAIRYRRPLNPFHKYRLVTQILGWDEKWGYIGQQFERGGKVCAHAVVQVTMLRDGKRVPIHELVAMSGYDGPEIPPPEWAQALVAAEPRIDKPTQDAA